MARTEVGSAYVSIYPDTSHFSEQLEQELSSSRITGVIGTAGERASQSFSTGFSAVSVAIGNLLSNAVMGAVDLFTQNLQRGIARLDTIANFPKLMQTFGYSVDDANASVVAIQQHLDGLPGSTDEVLRLVQAISDSTGSLDLATSAGIAFNDMLTASGADAYTTMMSMRMFDQMMGGAEFTSQRWMALVSKMPLQFSLLARSILGPTASAQDLGEALQNGDVTMKQIAETMTELGPRFEEQARAMSYGIGTAMTNYGHRMAAGVAKILDVVGQENIAKFIDKMGYGIRDAMYTVAQGVEWLIVKIKTSKLDEVFGQVVQKAKDLAASIDWEPLKQFFRDAINFTRDALQWVLDHGDAVRVILATIGGAIAAMIAWDLGTKIAGIIAAITAFVSANPIGLIVVAVSAAATAIYAFLTQTEEGGRVLEWLKGVVDVVAQGIEAAAGIIGIAVQFLIDLVTAAVDVVVNIVMWIGNAISAVGDLVGSVKGRLSNLGTALKKIWNDIRNAATAAWTKIKNSVVSLVEKIRDSVKAAWDKIKSIVTTIADAIRTSVTKAWESLKVVTSTAMNAIKGIVEPIWNAIKSFIEGVVKLITSIVKGDFEGMKSAVSTIFNGIKSLAESIWNGIKTTITTVVDGIKTAASTAWNGMKTTASTIWNGIKSAATTAWEGIKGAITAPIDAAKSAVSTIMSGMQGIINKLTGKKVDVGVNDSRTAVSNIVNGIQNKINGLKGKTVTVNVQKGGINGIDINAKAAGGGWYMTTYAAGGIATRATAGIFGEAGDEAIIPLSNRNKVRPFARAVATEIDVDAKGGVMVTGNNFYVRNDNDIDRIAEAINRQGMRQMAGRL